MPKFTVFALERISSVTRKSGTLKTCDAVIVVVSEETGIISIAVGGKLIRELDRKQLHDKLSEFIVPSENDKQDLFKVLFKNRKEKEEDE